MEGQLVGALIGVAGLVLGFLVRPYFDRRISRDQWQRTAVAALVDSAMAHRRALLDALAARAYRADAESAFRLASSDLKARAVVVLDKDLRESAIELHTRAWGVANLRGFGAFPDRPVDTDSVWSSFDALCDRVPAILKRLA